MRQKIDKENVEKIVSSLDIGAFLWLDAKRTTDVGTLEGTIPPSKLKLKNPKTGKVKTYDLNDYETYEVLY